MADESHERARKELDKDREALEKGRAEYAERMKGKPTPTQEENDLHALGATFMEHEDDGGGPDPNVPTRHVEAKPGGGYATRHVTARPTGAKPT